MSVHMSDHRIYLRSENNEINEYRKRFRQKVITASQ
jgi:hypothetical protein